MVLQIIKFTILQYQIFRSSEKYMWTMDLTEDDVQLADMLASMLTDEGII